MYEWQPIATAPKDGSPILGRIMLPDGETSEVLKWDSLLDAWRRADAASALTLFPQEWLPVDANHLRDASQPSDNFSLPKL
jgi:hypothetical protein